MQILMCPVSAEKHLKIFSCVWDAPLLLTQKWAKICASVTQNFIVPIFNIVCRLLNIFISDFTATNCLKVSISSSVEGQAIPGTFIITSVYINDRPSYQNGKLYLYFYTDATCSFWVVGPQLGAKFGIAYVYDVSQDPSTITGTWTSLSTSSWQMSPAITVKCL
jgi:hypothetical protein